MKIAIINDIHVGKPLERNKHLRSFSHTAEEILPALLNRIEKVHSPNIVVHLGDLIRAESKEIDLEQYRRAICCFKQVASPVIHLLGNHDIKHLSPNEVEQIWSEQGFPHKSFGVKEVGGVSIIWLGMEFSHGTPYFFNLPEDQLEWLGKTLQEIRMPAIIFTHCAIDDHDVTGNFFYESNKIRNRAPFFLNNFAKIQDLISKSRVELVVQAHLHYFHSKWINGIPYVTCPAMGDHLCGQNVEGHFPEIYSILTLNENQLNLKAYSKGFCFAGMEFPRNVTKI